MLLRLNFTSMDLLPELARKSCNLVIRVTNKCVIYCRTDRREITEITTKLVAALINSKIICTIFKYQNYFHLVF